MRPVVVFDGLRSLPLALTPRSDPSLVASYFCGIFHSRICFSRCCNAAIIEFGVGSTAGEGSQAGFVSRWLARRLHHAFASSRRGLPFLEKQLRMLKMLIVVFGII